MKRIIMLAMALMMMLASIGGCWIPYEEGGRGDRDGRHDRGGGHDRNGGYDRDGGHDERH